MVRSLALFDAPHERTRRRIDAVLHAHGYVWLFVNARWSRSARRSHKSLLRLLRARLAGESYRVLFIDIRGRTAVDAHWVTALPKERLACR